MAELGDPGSFRTQIGISQRQIVVLEYGGADEIVEIQLRNFSLESQASQLCLIG